MAEEAARDYQSSLEELTFNSKLHINVLTMIAGENHENGYAADIVKVIESHIAKAAPSQKLPVLYLMDSIMKNLRDSQYVTLFSSNIVANFALVFEQVDEKKRQSMYKLRQTWNDIFSNAILYAIDCKINELDPAWPITAQKEDAVIIPSEAIEDQIAGTSEASAADSGLVSPSIHVNPKFLKKEDLAKQKEEDKFRAELLLKQKELEEKKRRREEEQKKKQLEEEQEKKMREEFMAKQQELMRLQQQKLELELEETRRTLKKKELEFKRKEELDRIKEQEREKEHLRELEDARKLAFLKQEEERKEKELKEKERQEKERKAKERAEEERKEKERKLEEIKKAAVRSRDPRKAKNDSRNVKAAANSRQTPSPAKLDKINRKTDSPVRKGGNSQASDRSDTRKRKEKGATGHKVSKSERHYRRGRHSSSSGSDDEDKKLEIKPKRTRSRTPERRKRKLSPSGTEVLRHKKSVSKVKDQHAAAPEPIKMEESPAQSEEAGIPKETDDPNAQTPKKNKGENKKDMTDILELFGKEDKDYRKLPPIPKLQNPSLLDSTKSPSVGWTKFKQARPETFSFKQPRRMSFDNELKSPLSANRGSIAGVNKPTALSNAEDILKYAELQRSRGILTKEQHEDLLKQLSELYRLQRLQEEARARRESIDKKQMPALKPPPKPPLLESPGSRKTLLPNPIQPGRETIMNLNFHEESSRSPLGADEMFVDGGPKQPLLPPPLPPRTLLEVPRRPRDSLLSAPSEGPRVAAETRPIPLLEMPINGPTGDLRHEPMPGQLLRPRFDRPREPIGFAGGRGPRARFPPRMPMEPFDRMLIPRSNGREQDSEAAEPCEPMARGPAVPMETDQVMPPWYDPNKVYVPECDHRWYRRVHFPRDQRFRMTKFEVVINGNPYDISIGRRAKPKKISFGNKPRSVRLDPDTCQLFIDNKVYYSMHEHERQVVIGGVPFHIYLRGPPVKLWIDGHQFEVRLDAPPEGVLIANVSYDLIIDRQSKKVVVNGVPVCPWDEDGVHEVFLGPGDSRHVFQFFPPSRRILIDGEECVLDLSKRFPAVKIKGKWHGIRFDGTPRKVFINDRLFTVEVDRPSKIKINDKPHLLALGGPGHELIIEDEWYEVKFGGPPVFAKIGSKTCKLQLKGPPPEVKILGVVKTKEEVERPGEFHTDANEQPHRQLTSEQSPHRLGGRRGARAMQEAFEEERDYYSDGSPCRPDLPRKPTGGTPKAAQQVDVFSKPSPGLPGQDKPAEASPLNVNELFSKLLSSGIIKKVEGVDSPSAGSPASQPARESPVPGGELPPAPVVAGPQPIVIQPIPEAPVGDKSEDLPKESAMEITEEEKSQEGQESISKATRDYYSTVPWLGDFDIANMKDKYRDVVRCMYTGVQCTSCAARFQPDKTAEYKEHLDWHFRQNKRETQDSKVVRNRRWFYEITDWAQYEEVRDADERVVSNYFENMIQSIQSAIGAQSGPPGVTQKGHDTCPVASGNDEENMCDICRDPFEQFYDDDEEEWHLRDAVRVDGRTYHPVCYEDFKEQLDNNDGENDEETRDEETAMDVAPTPAEDPVSEPTKAESDTKKNVKTDPSVKEGQSTAPAPIIDMVTNPLAYLTALSQRAKQANTSLNEAAKLTPVPENGAGVAAKSPGKPADESSKGAELSDRTETLPEKETDKSLVTSNAVDQGVNQTVDSQNENQSSQASSEQNVGSDETS